MSVAVKAIHKKPSRLDGTRVFVDRDLPDGVNSQVARIDAWLQSLAPSENLERSLDASRAAWIAFRRKYLKEIARPEAEEDLRELYRLADSQSKVTLISSSRDDRLNNAVILKDLLDGMRKPPTSTGSGAVAVRNRKVQHMPRR